MEKSENWQIDFNQNFPVNNESNSERRNSFGFEFVENKINFDSEKAKGKLNDNVNIFNALNSIKSKYPEQNINDFFI